MSHSRRSQFTAAAVLVAAIASPVSRAQVADAPDDIIAGVPINYTEAKVGDYTLPDPLELLNGKRVDDAATWREKRRPEVVRLFEDSLYGRCPGRPADMSFDVFDAGTPAFEGKALRRQVTVYFSKDRENGPKMDLLVYLPAGAIKPVPLVLNLSFAANCLTVDDPGVKEGMIWNREHQLVPASQGRRSGSLDVPRILERGFGVATVYYGDIEPDFAGGRLLGVRRLYAEQDGAEPAPDTWGAIAAWSWGLSRALDYLETDPGVDAKRVALFGISRLGKTVLWTGARDERFALVIASCSGEGGAALARRNYGETIAHLGNPKWLGYQFCGNCAKYVHDANALPVDTHMLIALIAPRPLLLQTGNTDRWSDPKGEFLAAVGAEPVYHLLGARGLEAAEMPAAGQSILHTLGYFMHDGGHGTVPADWDVFLDFLSMHLMR